MKVLVACEESQRVAKAFRELGQEAYSCDIQEPSGEMPEIHIMHDVLPYINGNCIFKTMDGVEHRIDQKWDLIVAHPSCQYLTSSGNRWFNVERYGDKARERIKRREEAAEFFMKIANADCDHIAIENPSGFMSSIWRKPDQTIQPWMFGDPFEKRTCLWLKNLPQLVPTDIVEPPPRQVLSSGKTMPRWYSNCGGDRPKARSKTFPGIAKAIATQWTDYLLTKDANITEENK